MHVYSYRPKRQPNLRKRRSVGRLILGLAMVLFGLFLVFNRAVGDNSEKSGEAARQESTGTGAAGDQNKPKELPGVQEEIDNFVNANRGEYSVVVADAMTGKKLGEHNAEIVYFGASLYKVYVAYLGYIDIQQGKHNLEQPFLGAWTRKDCLDKMIRESHSPCAEKLWAEQDKSRSTERLKTLGLNNTNMEGLTTTAQDVNTVLIRLYQRKDLNDKHTEFFLESLGQNIYRDVLPAALPDLAVMDKVGFREFVEYHDAGIIILPSGRAVTASILTRNAGTKRMVELVKAMFVPLTSAP